MAASFSMPESNAVREQAESLCASEGLVIPVLAPARLECWKDADSGEAMVTLLSPAGSAYLFRRKLQKACYGHVWQAVKSEAPKLGEPDALRIPKGPPQFCAIKVSELKRMKDCVSHENVFKEVAAMRHLSTPGHPHVLPLTDALTDGRHVFTVTPLCDGGDLLAGAGQMTEDHARRICRQMLEGLAYLHSQGFCHRDLSPENIFLTAPIDEGGSIMLADLGMCRRITLNVSGGAEPLVDMVPMGKLRVMAPEVFHRQAYDGFKADIYAVAIIMVVAISGRYPYDAPIAFGNGTCNRFHCLVTEGPEVLLERLGFRGRLSLLGLSFLCRIFLADPATRPASAADLLQDPWFS